MYTQAWSCDAVWVLWRQLRKVQNEVQRKWLRELRAPQFSCALCTQYQEQHSKPQTSRAASDTADAA